jgi:predicted secreted hydrolase
MKSNHSQAAQVVRTILRFLQTRSPKKTNWRSHKEKLSYREKRAICLSANRVAPSSAGFCSFCLRLLCSLCLTLSSFSSAQTTSPHDSYRPALPGYRYEFPRDNFAHPTFQTEWWYYTGNLKSASGHRFGFELTFFRQAIARDSARKSAWEVDDVYFAHLALSDLDAGHFYHSERTNRSGPGIAGVSEAGSRIWNGNWQIEWKNSSDQLLQAISDSFELHFTLHSEKPPVIHGENGVSQKAQGPGRASHYISLTRLITSGEILLNGEKFEATGLSWMDHEFFTHQLESNQTGWDWFSIQLDDHTELMLYRIRQKDGSLDPFSAGTFIDAQGRSTHLRASDFSLHPSTVTWTSPDSHATYPLNWQISIPQLNISLEATTLLASQEFTSTGKLAPTYWEGAVVLTGTRNSQPLQGAGYLEMTGYDRPVRMTP